MWSRVAFKTLVAISGPSIVVLYKICNNSFRVYANDAPQRWKSWNYNWDCREIKPTTKSPSASGDNCVHVPIENNKQTAKRNIFLIRHGNYNKQTKQLNKKGIMQIKFTTSRLSELGHHYVHDLHSSTLPRAIETAKIIISKIKKLDLVVNPSLCEGVPIFPEPPSEVSQTPIEKVVNDGLRIEAAFQTFFHRADPEQREDSFEIIVCHSNVIRALQLPPEAWTRFSINHGSITWLVIHPDGRVQLKSLGDSEYMPRDYVSVA